MIDLLQDEAGASALEYAFIAALIFLAIVSSITALGERSASVIEAAEQGFNNE